MKKTMKEIGSVIGVLMTIGMLCVGVYASFTTLLARMYSVLLGISWPKTKRMLANFFGLITYEEEKILNEREEVED